MKKKILSFALAIVMVLSLFTAMPMTAYAQPPEYSCVIVETAIEYATLSDALAVVANGQTIKLLTSITYSSSITADNKIINIDLNGFNLTVDNVAVHALQAINNGILNISDEIEIGVLTVNSSGAEKYAAYASSGGKINIKGNLTAKYPGGFYNQNIYGAFADGTDSEINIIGNSTGYSGGIYAQHGAVITVTGNVSGSYYGAYAAYGGLVDITGEVNAGTNGLTVEYGGLAEIDGDITGGTAIYIMNGIGWDDPYAIINGNVVSTGTCAIDVSYSSNIIINGNIGGRIDVSGSTTTSPAITVNGDITVNSGYGVNIHYGGTVTVNGAIIGASPYLRLNNIDISVDDYVISGNYYVYSNTTYNEYYPPYSPNTVKVKKVEPPENHAPVLTSNWNYSTVHFGQDYPFTISVTDYENSPNTHLYSFIDSASPSQAYNFAVVPGTVNITLSPLEEVLPAGSHTLNYYATDSDGATSSVLVLPFTIVSNFSNNASLSSISIEGINLTPAFNTETISYTANVSNIINSATITAEPSDSSATVTISGTEGTTKDVVLSVGSNTIEIVVTAADEITTKTYTLNIERARSSGSSSTVRPIITVITEKSGGFTTNSTKIDTEISSGTALASVTKAIVNALLDKSNASGGNSKEDLIKVIVDTPSDINKLQISITQSELDMIASETDANFGIESPFISIVFDEKAIETIANTSNEGNVVISAERLDNINGRPVFDLTVTNNGKTVSDFNGGHATITVPYTLKQGENPNAVVVYFLTDDGGLQTVRGHYDAAKKAVVFKTTHFSKFMIGCNPITFSDVSANVWYKNAVDFIAAREITSGTGKNLFSPDDKLTRGQFAVLLMNSYGISPEMNQEFYHISNFNDSGDNYYADYLLVANGLGIVNGIGNNLFAPEKEITRQEMFVMLYNALKVIGEIPASSNDKQLSSFNDAVEVADWAEEALSTLVKASIVSGNNNSLNPTSSTTRAEIAQMLYNLLSK